MDSDRLERRQAEDREFRRRLNEEPETGRFAEPRSWLARTTDEVAAWFGNTDALRRRQRDEAVGDHRGLGPKTQIDDDTRILEEVSRQLTLDRMLNASRVQITVEARVVTLTGEVTTSADKLRAEHIASTVAGVTSVDDRLIVG
jgi:osmotically-inducible protein OsmY